MCADVYERVWRGAHSLIYVQVSGACAHVYKCVWRGVKSHIYVQVSGACVPMCIHVYGGEGCALPYLCSGEWSMDADVYTCIQRPMVAIRSLL